MAPAKTPPVAAMCTRRCLDNLVLGIYAQIISLKTKALVGFGSRTS